MIKNISIEKIIIPKTIDNYIKKHYPNIDMKNYFIEDQQLLPLHKMDSFINLNIPIKVNKKFNYYFILDGRHRVTKSIINQNKFILAQIFYLK